MADVKTTTPSAAGGAGKAYVPPSQRKKEEQQQPTNLDTSNTSLFPTLGGGPAAAPAPTPKPATVDFKQTVLDRIAKDKEEADQLALPPEEDPLKMTPEELEVAGFEVLKPKSVTVAGFNERLAAWKEQDPDEEVYEDGISAAYQEALRVAAAPTLYEAVYGYPPVYDSVNSRYVVRKEDYVLTIKKKVRAPTAFDLAMERKKAKVRAAREASVAAV
jgi:hypothetical protein